MDKKTNRYQNNYRVAKAALKMLESMEENLEANYIIDHGIKNSDGEIPSRTFMIEDEETFDKANSELSKAVEASGLWGKILAARENIEKAERELLNYGLSIMPASMAKERETLTKAIKTNYTTRIKFIELVMKLDTKSVTAV